MRQNQHNRSNYDKYPEIAMPQSYLADCFAGWQSIGEQLKQEMNTAHRRVMVVECYQGVILDELATRLHEAFPQALLISSGDAMLSETELTTKLKNDITDDEIFGYMTRLHMDCYFDPKKVSAMQRMVNTADGQVIVYGTGAAYVQPDYDLLVYADMARWEIQMRFRRNEVGNVGCDNRNERASLQYKRGFFVDWRICDRFKKSLMSKWDYVLDTNVEASPKMVSSRAVKFGLKKAVSQPFRVVPFFDPGPWGGQWMKEVCDLDRQSTNFAWCFDCVPEENSLLLGFGNVKFEMPSINLVFAHPCELLGNPVHGRFGDEFPIRFDFLDTMDGGNLSLQVHPLTEYIQEKFGMHYTQDESYYMLDVKDDAVVYLGLKKGVNPDEMIGDLEHAQKSGEFDAEKYVGVYPVKKHDHVLIPSGTIHCSGTNGMVLEISATPYIFTFKLWDWGRLGLDGRPRPINIAHGKNVIQWERDEKWVRNNVLNQTIEVASGDGWVEEHTGLHEREFIETRRHWFSKPVLHRTNGSVNVLNLVEGREAIVESPEQRFEPFVVHYAETFIIPEAVKEYSIRPYGESEGKQCATIKAFVKCNV